MICALYLFEFQFQFEVEFEVVGRLRRSGWGSGLCLFFLLLTNAHFAGPSKCQIIFNIIKLMLLANNGPLLSACIYHGI